jgi:RND family efflux transporter MFP subunit
MGDKVKEGALLCEIDTPEVDQQLAQAKAQLAQADAGLVQAQANAAFSKVNAARYEGLTPAGLASQQDLEKQRAQAAVDAANVKVAEANVQAQKANVAHLAQLRSFSRITAPFSGTIVARTAERGALVTAGNQTPLFTLASTETLRVFVQVPQDVAPGVRVDQPARVSFREYAGRTFDGKIAHAALALDAQTRTMTTEVRVPNPNGELLAGMYAQVAFTLPTPHRVFEVPASALMSDGSGVRVATVKADDTIRIVPVAIERDTGATIEIASGLVGDERIVRLASVKLVDGLAVDVKP